MSTTVYGIPVSPFVRKVLIALELKGVAYELEPVSPLNLPEGYKEISPLGKVPALKDDLLAISDSTVICEYLDERYPEIYLRPKSIVERARCRWFEEYADTRMLEAFGSSLFYERVIKPTYLDQETDEAAVQNALENLIPQVLEYLESQLPGAGFLFEERLTLADISLMSAYLLGIYAQYSLDADRYPKTAAYMDFIQRQEVFQERLAAEKAMLEGS